jgi:hypothetical protein
LTVYRVPNSVLSRTFEQFRRCGRGRTECQALWISAWQSPALISEVIHPKHSSHGQGFILDSEWLSAFWLDLARRASGIRVQVHTHPGEAFHSPTDDAYPIIHSPRFLSLVVPNFALGPISLSDTYLAEIDDQGRWREVPISSRLVIT